jgi:hypothetical protein
MDLITGTSSPDHDEPAAAAREYVEADMTPGGTPIPELHGPAAEPVEPIRAGAGAGVGRWIARIAPAVGGAAAITWAVLRARRR